MDNLTIPEKFAMVYEVVGDSFDYISGGTIVCMNEKGSVRQYNSSASFKDFPNFRGYNTFTDFIEELKQDVK